MDKVSTSEIRKKFLEFFKEKGHTIIPSASLIPENDPTVLFTTAGMHPLVPFLLGEKHPGGNKVASCQKCIRTGDIDEVGDDVHLTFFEMLGNWSFGDPDAPDGIGAGYFKKEAIKMSFEFLTKTLELPLEKLAVSVFEGDNDAPCDTESAALWEAAGISKNCIYFFEKQDNWWGPAGETGPCGPDTEMFYWTGSNELESLATGDNRYKWVEIWNNVFMEYNKQLKTDNQKQTTEKEYEFIPLKQKNVDTGMGLERTTAVLNGIDLFLVDTIAPVIKKIEELSGKKYKEDEQTTKAMRVVADHIRAATFILGDEHGIVPSNTGQGYVLRRLIRRAVRYGKLLGMPEKFVATIAAEVVGISGGIYSELEKNKEKILQEVEKEEKKFVKTLENGLKIIKNLFKKEDIIDTFALNDDTLFDLYQTYGFPVELSLEEINRERHSRGKLLMDESLRVKYLDRFFTSLKKHQELSRTASAGVFKGGLADHSEISTRYHTATHLLLAALRQLLGNEIYQKGSNITAERMRFDFNYPEKLTAEQIKQVEDLVNKKIQESIPVEILTMSKEEALASVKVSFDSSKYGDTVKVYKIGDFSVELCGGPHVQNTKEIGTFRIVKEEAVSAGVRRIKGVISG